MQNTSGAEQIDALYEAAVALRRAGQILNVVIAYEDASAHRWADQMTTRLEKQLGSGMLLCTWLKIGDLSQPEVLAGAAAKAVRADVIIVAIQEAEVFPLPLYVWFSSWLPHRRPKSGLLAALIRRPKQIQDHAGYAGEYLQMVATVANLKFVMDEKGGDRRLPKKHSRLTSPQPAIVARLSTKKPESLFGYSVRRWRKSKTH